MTPSLYGPSPLDQLLLSRGAQQGTFTSKLTPSPLPMDPLATVKNSSQLGNFYDRLNSIKDRTEEEAAAAEDMIFRQIQKKKEEALLKKIKAMIPQQPSGGGGFNAPNLSPPNYSGGGGNSEGGSSDFGGKLKLPRVAPPGGGSIFPPVTPAPKVAPPRVNCFPWMHNLGWC